MGPLTLRQLIILAIGFGTSYMLFSVLNRIYELNFLEYGIIILPGLISTAFALIKVNDIPLTKFLFLFLEFSIKPKKRVWDHRGISGLVDPDLSPKTSKKPIETESVMDKEKQAANLTELTKMLDSGAFEHIDKINHDDMDKSHDDDLVTQAYFGNKDNKTENMYWRTKASHLEMLKIFAKLPVTQLKEGTKETEIARKEIMKVKKEVEDEQKKRGFDTKNETLNPKEKTKKPKRKRKKTPSPARPNHRIDNTQKNQPVKYQKAENPTKRNKPVQQKKTKPSQNMSKNIKKEIPNSKKGEFTFEELSDKDSIEINLD